MKRKIQAMQIVRVDKYEFENELVADIMSLMTSFTATLHSRRKHQSKEYRKRMETEGIVA